MRNLILILLVSLLLSCKGGDSGSPQLLDPLCNTSTGLQAPLPACSSETVCTRVASELNMAMIDTPTITPSCDLAVWDGRLTQNILGFTRHACIYRVPGASNISKRPLLLWFHPGGDGPADLAATETGLIDKADTFDLTGDPVRPGFTLVSVQGRNLRFPTAEPRDGRHHDFYYRDLNSPSTNPDIANVDALIDAIVLEGIVDTNRIYVAGWSNGAFFSQLYAIARNTTPTAGGNRVASATVFAAASPFGDISWNPFNETINEGTSSCNFAIPASTVPIHITYRSSDAAVACDALQASCFSTEPGYTTDQWIMQATLAGLQVTGLRLGGLERFTPVALDAIAPSCTDYSGGCPVGACDTDPFGDTCLSIVNHARWPDGAYNNFPLFGIDRENDMLQFLRDNPLF
jgi:poly(3-hydroxybutyrate) depolymerase